VTESDAHSNCQSARYNTLQHTATHCNTLQHTATHCNTLQHTATHCNTLQRTATHCNTLQHTATHCDALHHTATHCITLQHTATHCDRLQHTATHCNTLRHTASYCLKHTATHCTALRHNATHCRTLQHTATLVIRTGAITSMLRFHKCVPWHTFVKTEHGCDGVWHDSFIFVPWLMYMWAMTHCHDSCIYTGGSTSSSMFSSQMCAARDFVCALWHLDGAGSCVAACCSVFQCFVLCCTVSQRVALWRCDDASSWVTLWRRLIGSPKLQIIFHKRSIKFRSLLRKMTWKDKGSYESSPPCTLCCTMLHFAALCCTVFQCVAACCKVVQMISCYYIWADIHPAGARVQNLNKQRLLRVSCSVLQCVGVSCSVLQCVAVCCCVLLCVAVSLSSCRPALCGHESSHTVIVVFFWNRKYLFLKCCPGLIDSVRV